MTMTTTTKTWISRLDGDCLVSDTGNFQQTCSSRLFVRPCYRDLFELCQTRWDGGIKGVFLHGTPGVGKSCFLDYVLHRCLYDQDKRKNVLFLDGLGGEALLFQHNMVGQITRTDHSLSDLSEKRVRIPSDAYDIVCFDPPDSGSIAAVYSLVRGKEFIVAVLPIRRHCKGLYKNTATLARVYMGPLSMEEAEAMRACCYAHVPQDVLQRRYRKIGGIARYLYRRHCPQHGFDATLEEVERDQTAALNDITRRNVGVEYNEVYVGFEYLWSLYHMVPTRPDYSSFTIELACKEVQTRMRDTLMMHKKVKELWELYLFTSEKTLKGIHYEAYAHKKMMEHGVNLEATSLTTFSKRIRIPALLPRINLTTNDVGETLKDAINRARRLATGGYLLPETSDLAVGDSLFASRTETLSLQMIAGGRQPMSGPSASLLQATAAGDVVFVVPDESIVTQELECAQGDGPGQWGLYCLVLKEDVPFRTQRSPDLCRMWRQLHPIWFAGI